MSREAINKLFIRAMIDPPFAQRLLDNPLQTALNAGFELTMKERDIFAHTQANTISELSEKILMQTGYENPR